MYEMYNKSCIEYVSIFHIYIYIYVYIYVYNVSRGMTYVLYIYTDMECSYMIDCVFVY